jgi:hypothetical protein
MERWGRMQESVHIAKKTRQKCTYAAFVSSVSLVILEIFQK